MTLTDAAAGVGRHVVYRPGDRHAKATAPERLAWVAIARATGD